MSVPSFLFFPPTFPPNSQTQEKQLLRYSLSSVAQLISSWYVRYSICSIKKYLFKIVFSNR